MKSMIKFKQNEKLKSSKYKKVMVCNTYIGYRCEDFHDLNVVKV